MPSSYIGWQNRGVDFYLAARMLWWAGLAGPAAFCGYQAVELMLKSALVHHDSAFDPQTSGHALAKLTRMVNNKGRPDPAIAIPTYFHHERRFLVVTRYPRPGRGVRIPGSFIDDLDKLTYELACLVPVRKNTRLGQAIVGVNSSARMGLEVENRFFVHLEALFRI